MLARIYKKRGRVPGFFSCAQYGSAMKSATIAAVHFALLQLPETTRRPSLHSAVTAVDYCSNKADWRNFVNIELAG
jgi:hypothetical protein